MYLPQDLGAVVVERRAMVQVIKPLHLARVPSKEEYLPICTEMAVGKGVSQDCIILEYALAAHCLETYSQLLPSLGLWSLLV